MKDILDRNDIVQLVDSFYARVTTDDFLKHVFDHVDWPNHLPTMYNFWASMLLGDQSYQGNPLQKHIHLAIDSSHFSRWLELFTQTVDEHFEGIKAAEAKGRARNIAGMFQYKLGLMEK